MVETTNLLRQYLQGVRHFSGARCASLFVPGAWSEPLRAMLLHEGELPPVPEMADLARCLEFQRGMEEAAPDRGAPGPDPAGPDAGPWPERQSGSPEGVLLPLPAQAWLPGAECPEQPQRRQSDLAPQHPFPLLPAAWLGLAFDVRRPEERDAFLQALHGAEPGGLWGWLLALGGAAAGWALRIRTVLDDPVSGLPGRAQLQQSLTEEIARTRRSGHPLCLLLLEPDGFAAVQERFGAEAANQVARELGAGLRAALRNSDLVATYGGVLFGAVLLNTTARSGVFVAEKLLALLVGATYLGGAVKLKLSCGIAAFDPKGPEDEALEAVGLIWRADHALSAAKRLDGSRVLLWHGGIEAEGTVGSDRLTGIFTGDLTRDYRHMVLLWNTVSVIAASADVRALAEQVIGALHAAYPSERMGLFQKSRSGELELLYGLGVAAAPDPSETGSAQAAAWALVRQACQRSEVVGERLPGVAAGGNELAYQALAVPLTARRDCVGCLYLDGSKDSLKLDAVDVLFLRALGGQLAMALERALLEEQERQRREQSRLRLEAELHELRGVLAPPLLVHRSHEIERVLATARRVAPTSATILLSGESGTGKELLARMIHQLSPRRERPMVVIDCAAISASLVDSELFGHERGAYTGATQRSVGRLAEAEGGTVLLDEIGELPLEMQSKLLRFLQERQVTAVGATRARQLDVRILAATNRDLAAEVEAGRFRADLYFRLDVVHLVLPPLRDRRGDVPLLAQHFLEHFSRQQHKSLRGFDAEATLHLQRYSWPGNVRELQNRVMRAVILCEGEEIGPSELALPVTAGSAPPAAGSEPRGTIVRLETRRLAGAHEGRAPGFDEGRHSAGAGSEPSVSGVWQSLREQLERQVELLAAAGARGAVPLGRWLSEDLLVEADAAAHGVLSRGAALVGIPQTTFRRRLAQARARGEAGLSTRPASWTPVRRLLERVLQSEAGAGEDLMERLRRLLLELVAARLGQNTAASAALLGITEPTYRRWVARLPAGPRPGS